MSNASWCSNIRTRRFLSNEDCHFDNPWLGRRIGLTLPGCIGDVGPTIRRTSGPERTRRSGPAVAPSPPAPRGCWRPDRQCAERCRPSCRADPRCGRAAEGAGRGPSWRGRAPPAAGPGRCCRRRGGTRPVRRARCGGPRGLGRAQTATRSPIRGEGCRRRIYSLTSRGAAPTRFGGRLYTASPTLVPIHSRPSEACASTCTVE